MQAARKLAVMGCATMVLYLLTVSGAADAEEDNDQRRQGSPCRFSTFGA